uniref:Putative death ligand signal enhancer n=1 Tax=Anopheles braziliensis TaxID=58242 RepID=A0A2M3ZG37_9DIPT
MWKYVSRRIRDVYDRTAGILEVRRTWNCGPGERFCAENPPEEGVGASKDGGNGKRFCLLQKVRPNQLDGHTRKEYGTGSNQSEQEGFKRKEHHQPRLEHSWIGAITWTSAIICGWYTSQLLCLYRRTQRVEYPGGRCYQSPLLRTAAEQNGLSLLHCRVLSEYFRQRTTTVPSVFPIEPRSSSSDCASIGREPAHGPSFASFGGPPFSEFVDYTDSRQSLRQNFTFRINNDRKPTGSVAVPDPSPSRVHQPSVTPTVELQQHEPETIESAIGNLLNVLGEIEYQLGCQNLEQGEYSAAVSHLKLGTSHQHAGAAFNLGVCYEQGYGLPKDLRMALECYQLAAEQGHPQALYNLGVFYARGSAGLRPSRSMAKKYFVAAAELGLEEAIRALGPKYQPARQPSMAMPVPSFEKASISDNERQFSLVNVDQFHPTKRIEEWTNMSLRNVSAHG